MTIYSLDVLLFLFGTSLLFHVQFLLLLDLLYQEPDQVVCYSHLFENFPQFVVIHTVKGFSVVTEAEINVFLELPCLLHDPTNVGNLISGSSASLKPSLKLLYYLLQEEYYVMIK